MFKPFNFYMPFTILFGQGKFELLPDLIAKRCTKVLLVFGGCSFRQSKYYDYLIRKLTENKIHFETIQIETEPTPQNIDNAVNNNRTFAPELVVAIGGGSVLDGGKAISAMLTKEDSIVNYLEGIGTKTHNGKKIPFVAVPTTSGTGSEATKNAVITQIGENGYKKSIRHDNFVADIAIIDPDLTVSCSPKLTACCGMDSFTQLLESYLSTNSNPMTDSLAFQGIEAVAKHLVRAVQDGTDIQARIGMAYASFTGGICLANAGLGTVHGFASSIGGLFEIPHGVVCGTLMAVCNELTVKRLQEGGDPNNVLQKYADVGKLFCEDQNLDNSFYVDFLIKKLYELTDLLSIPRLGKYGVSEEAIEKIIPLTDNKSNPVKLTNEDFETILKSRI